MLRGQARSPDIATSLYYEFLVVRGLKSESKHGIIEVKPSQWRGLRSWRYRLADAAGAYELVLWDQRRGVLNAPETSSIRFGEPLKLEFDEAIFLIRYFPHPDEPCFDDFAVEEQSLRLSEVFANGSALFPVDGFEDRLNEFHFNVGLMMVAAGVFHGVVRLSLMSQERFVSVAEDGITLLGRQIVKPGEVDRNVPGWQLSWRFFSKIAKVYVENLSTPFMIVERDEPGRLWTCRTSGCHESLTKDYLLKTLEIIFLTEKDEYIVEVIQKILDEISFESASETGSSSEKGVSRFRVLWREGKWVESHRRVDLQEILGLG